MEIGEIVKTHNRSGYSTVEGALKSATIYPLKAPKYALRVNSLRVPPLKCTNITAFCFFQIIHWV